MGNSNWLESTRTKKISKELATDIYDLFLIQFECLEKNRNAFLLAMQNGDREYRFQGNLGFGGRFFNTDEKWYVKCYIDEETETETKLKDIKEANELLEKWRELYYAA